MGWPPQLNSKPQMKDTAMNEPENTNCLEDFTCPECGWAGDFIIWTTAPFRVTDDGTEQQGPVEWNEDNQCACGKCAHHGTVAEFTQARLVLIRWFGTGEKPSLHGPFKSMSEVRQYAAQHDIENWDIEPLQLQR
jgi:hypothetical protein